MKINFSLKYLVPFLFLIILCGTSHEFVHHFVGAAICGCFGYKTFNSFQLCGACREQHPLWFLATYAGPLFTFALLWLGLYKLKQPDDRNKQLGFALIFANFPVNRILFALIGANDEQYITRIFFGHSPIAFWITNIVIWLFTIPPLYFGYKVIENKRKLLWFMGFFLLPMIFVIMIGLFLEEWLLIKKHFLAETTIGIPHLILLAELICTVGYFSTKKYLYIKN